MLLRVFLLLKFKIRGLLKRTENGHHILSGEQYLEIVYLQKKEQKKAKVKYQHPKKYKLISIHTAEVFITNVALDENLCMDLNEYQSVMATAI